MKTAIIIPARYESGRFPGKPLALIRGRPMIHWVYSRCVESSVPPARIYVATDDDRIALACRLHNIQTVMTSSDCRTGTDRVYEASQQIDADMFINVQGDEPMVKPDDIDLVISAARRDPTVVYNAMCPITSDEDFRNSSIPKVVCRPDGSLLYASRAAIPTTKSCTFVAAFKQVCIYAFPRDALRSFASATKKTPLEAIEDIEILRFIEMGRTVTMVKVSGASIAVDHPEDILRVEAALGAKAANA